MSRLGGWIGSVANFSQLAKGKSVSADENAVWYRLFHDSDIERDESKQLTAMTYSVAVFCGSRPGHDPVLRAAARDFGTGLARAGHRLVYGAGRNGLMGILADAALAAGGQVVGVIPEFLKGWEVAHEGLSELVVVDSMHARKTRMFELSDVAVMLPGGLGTLDETLEIITWRQLRLHARPTILCDVSGSAQAFVAMVEACIKAGFTPPDVRQNYIVADGVDATLDLLTRLPRAANRERAERL